LDAAVEHVVGELRRSARARETSSVPGHEAEDAGPRPGPVPELGLVRPSDNGIAFARGPTVDQLSQPDLGPTPLLPRRQAFREPRYSRSGGYASWPAECNGGGR
jgi:hypothetical protein